MTSDTRQCFLAIESRRWAITTPVALDQEGARNFAAKVNAAVAAVEPADAPGAAPAIDVT
jgi:hypothetical protein